MDEVIDILLIILGAAAAVIVASITIAGVISREKIIEKIRELLQTKKFRKKHKDLDPEEDILGAMIREVSKNKKTVKVDILTRTHDTVSSEVFTGDDVSDDISEGDVILI